jgi:trk system potassium uptake protein
MMHVIIVGCGRVGSALAGQFDQEGHSVAVIDRAPSAFRRLPESFGGTTVVGVGFDRDRLIEAGVERADAVGAVTSGDNTNILTARVAREAFGVERVVARIYDVKRARIYERMGVPTVATTAWTSDRFARTLFPSQDHAVWAPPQEGVVVLERPVHRSVAGRPIEELEGGGLGRIVALSRDGASILPTSGLAAQEGDVMWVAVASDGVADYDRATSAVTEPGVHA